MSDATSVSGAAKRNLVGLRAQHNAKYHMSATRIAYDLEV